MRFVACHDPLLPDQTTNFNQHLSNTPTQQHPNSATQQSGKRSQYKPRNRFQRRYQPPAFTIHHCPQRFTTLRTRFNRFPFPRRESGRRAIPTNNTGMQVHQTLSPFSTKELESTHGYTKCLFKFQQFGYRRWGKATPS